MPKEKQKVVGQAVVEQLEVIRHVEGTRVPGRPNRSLGLPDNYILPDNLMERFVSFFEDDEWSSLIPEIALLRTMLSGATESWKEWNEAALQAVHNDEKAPPPPISLKDLASLTDNVGKMVERQHRMLYSANNLVTVEAAAMFALAVAAVVNKFVKDPEEKGAVLDAIRQLLTVGAGFQMDLGVVRRLISPVKER